MSWKIGCMLGLFVCSAPVQAATPGERRPKLSSEGEAATLARELVDLAQMISAQYVREVPVNDLVATALKGLYEAARQPFPREMAEALKNATNRHSLVELAIAARRNLGNDPALVGHKSLMAAIQALPSVLDAHCTLVPARTFQTAYEYQSGFGFELDGEPGSGRNVRESGFAAPRAGPPIPFRVVAVYPGGPAQRAGLRPGDVITNIDRKAVTADCSETLYQTVLLEPTNAADPKEHVFTVLRADKTEPVKIAIKNRIYVPESVFGVQRRQDNTWSFWLDESKKIAYIRIGAIDLQTPSQLNNALGQLLDGKGLILDLRWCPGGFLNQAAEVAGIFLGKGKIASVKYRQADRMGPNELRADAFGIRRLLYTDVPVLVLVNGDTSGGGELIAAALHDNDRAKVAGQRTLGKASVQSPLYLASMPNWAFKLSAGTFIRPNGKNLQRFSESKPDEDWGVRPDKGYEIPISPFLTQRLKEWHHAYQLRPPQSREAFPLDDPEYDPQRIQAMRLLFLK
jgi:carboxyl-terminal processing protease